MKVFAATATLLLATLASGAIHGHLVGRWGQAEILASAGKSLSELDKSDLGDWQFIEEQPFSESTVATLECSGQTARIYHNTKTGARVTMFVIVGPHGPTVAHTPDICYSSRDYTVHKEREKRTLKTADGKRHIFWVMTMKSRRAIDPHYLKVWYAWSDGELWSAKDHPRLDYLGQPRLYKIQLAARIAEEDAPDPVPSFLNSFLPKLQRKMK